MPKLIRISMEIDGEGETVTVPSLYDAGTHAASFIRHLDLEEHVDADVRVEVQIVDLKTEPGEPEF